MTTTDPYADATPQQRATAGEVAQRLHLGPGRPNGTSKRRRRETRS